MSKELIERLREAAASRVASTAMIGAEDLSAAADALESLDAAYGGAVEAGKALAKQAFKAEQERDALAAELKALREREPVNARLLAIVHQTVGMIENTSIETGCCCCGDGMDGHASPMICGHSATDQGAYLAGLLYEDAKSAIAAAEAQQAEPSSLSDKAASELQADAARYHYIRTHRIGIKWCELYAGGPLLDGVIDSFISAANPKPITS